MGAEIVLDQHNLLGAGKMRIRQFFQHLSVIGGGVAVGDLDARQPSSGENIMNMWATPLRSYS